MLVRQARVDIPAPAPPPAGFLESAKSAAPAVGGYLLVRLVATGLLWLWISARHRDLIGNLGNRWDSIWYLRIVQHGYDFGTPLHSDLAFFPLYPALIRAAAYVSPVGLVTTALVLAWLSALAAAWGLYAIGSRLYDHRTGVLLAVLWGVIPDAVIESMAYTEGLFTALSVWALYALMSERLLTAGLCCLLAGLSRPTASALVPVVCLAALIAVRRQPGAWRPWAALLLAPAGWIGYLVWVGLRVRRPDGWFHIQKSGWGSAWDGGYYTLVHTSGILTRPSPLGMFVVTLTLFLAVVLFALSLLGHVPWPLTLFSALLLATALGGSGFYQAKPRFLISAFPLLIPPAVALARARTGTAVTVCAALTLLSGYYGGYLLLVWQHSP